MLIFFQNHFTAIEQHEKALTEAEQRLKDLKAAGLKHVDVSQLELATAEARRKFEVRTPFRLFCIHLLPRGTEYQSRELSKSNGV